MAPVRVMVRWPRPLGCRVTVQARVLPSVLAATLVMLPPWVVSTWSFSSAAVGVGLLAEDQLGREGVLAVMVGVACEPDVQGGADEGLG